MNGHGTGSWKTRIHFEQGWNFKLIWFHVLFFDLNCFVIVCGRQG